MAGTGLATRLQSLLLGLIAPGISIISSYVKISSIIPIRVTEADIGKHHLFVRDIFFTAVHAYTKPCNLGNIFRL